MSDNTRYYRYVAKVGHATGRYGQTVKLLAWHRSKVLIEFDDGWQAGGNAGGPECEKGGPGTWREVSKHRIG